MADRSWSTGDTLAGKYRLKRELGRGGMGSVWEAEHLVLKSPVAIKLIRARGDDVEALRTRFLREAQAAAALRGPHVVQILDYGVHEDTPFMAMELLEGESLAQRLGRVGVLGPVETTRIVTHVARAIQKAHEAGVVHRDLKPDNIFLVRNADEEIAKVLDFGIAKTVVGDDPGQMATQTGAVLGTPHYMSPEQARGTRSVDHRTDIWALAVIAFQCVTGARPFESTVLGDLLIKICTEPIPPPSSLAAVPAGFDQWFARATERDPDQRFQSAFELAESLRSLVGGANVSIPAPYGVPTAALGPVGAPTHTPLSAAAALPPASGPWASPAPLSGGPSSAVAYDTAHQLGVARTQEVAPRAGAMPRLNLVVLSLAVLAVAGLSAVGFGAAVYFGTSAEPEPASSALVDPPTAVAEPPPSPSASAATPTAAKRSEPGGVPVGGGAAATTPKSGDAGAQSWQSDVAQAQADAKKAQEDAKKAQADAKKAQEDAAKAAAEAEAVRKKALEGLPK